jgi:hypothetical protein
MNFIPWNESWKNLYVFDVIVTSWALFFFCISWNFARDIWTVFEEIKHLRSRAPEKFYQIIKINKTQILLKYFFGFKYGAIYGTYSPQFFLWHWRRITCTKFFSWLQCTQTVFKIDTIIYRNISYLLMNFITWNESWNVQIVYINLMNHYLRKYLIKIWCVLYNRRDHTFDVKTCFQQNRYVFDVIVTSWALFYRHFQEI